MPPKRFPKREASTKKPVPIARPLATQVNGESSRSHVDGTQDSSHQETYEEELAWCIHKLKVSLTAKNVTSKQVDDIRKTVASLENPNVPVVKKRCLMKMTLGDYRKNMQAEKQRVPLELKNADITSGDPSTSSGHFMRKSHLATSAVNISTPFKPSDNSFRFNFNAINTESS